VSDTTHERESERAGEIGIEDFQKIDIRVGRVLAAEPLAGARTPAFALRIDFGSELGVKQSSAQVTIHYTAEQLVGRLVLAVVNFPPRRIAGFKSEVLTLGVPDAEGAVVLIRPDGDMPLGGRLF
jgi:tRNA-binding protein